MSLNAEESRRRTVGGTLVSRILGMSKWGGPLSAYYELVADVDAPRTAAMGRGTALESSVLALWAERERAEVLDGFLVSAPSMPHAHARIDALGLRPAENALIVLEAKTANSFETGEWGADGTDTVPEAYHLQALWYLGVAKQTQPVENWAELPLLSGPESELQWAAKMVQCTGKPLSLADLDGTGLVFRVCRVEWDEEVFAAMDREARRFLREHVEPRIPPAPGPGDVLLQRDLNAVARGIPAEAGRVLDFATLTAGEREALAEFISCARERRAWEEQEEQAKVRVQLLMGGAEEVTGLPHGAQVTWKRTAGGTRRFMTKFDEE
jgi:hypothetical protein